MVNVGVSSSKGHGKEKQVGEEDPITKKEKQAI